MNGIGKPLTMLCKHQNLSPLKSGTNKKTILAIMPKKNTYPG